MCSEMLCAGSEMNEVAIDYIDFIKRLKELYNSFKIGYSMRMEQKQQYQKDQTVEKSGLLLRNKKYRIQYVV